VSLQGWSAELALKNMEYKAVDDSKAQNVGMPGDEEPQRFGTASSKTDAPEEEVRGSRCCCCCFIFDSRNLSSKLRDQLTEDGDILIGQLKASELSMHGLQAMQRIISSANPLATLRDLSSNYPSVVGVLSKTRISDEVRSNLSESGRLFGSCVMPPPLCTLSYLLPFSRYDALIINGRVMRAETVHPYTCVLPLYLLLLLILFTQPPGRCSRRDGQV
jgi:hypothetical protein